MSDAGYERSKRIKTDYLAYLRILLDKKSEEKLLTIVQSDGDVDKKVSSSIYTQLGAYPRSIAATHFAGQAEKVYSTPTDVSGMMADNARNDTLSSACEKYREHRMASKIVSAVKLFDNPAAYIATIASRFCMRELGRENRQGRRIRQWYAEIITGSSFIEVHTKELFKRSVQTNLIGLRCWDQPLNTTGKERARELMEHPDEVRMRECFEVTQVRTREDLKDTVKEVLQWCGAAVNSHDLLIRVILPWCKIKVEPLDDQQHYEHPDAARSAPDAQREAISNMTVEAICDLFDKQNNKNNQENRDIFHLHFIQGWTYQEIIDNKYPHLTEDAVQKRVERAKAMLQREIRKADIFGIGNDQKVDDEKSPNHKR